MKIFCTKAITNSLLLSLAMIVLPLDLHAQIIKISSINKYEFKITNRTEFTIGFMIGSKSFQYSKDKNSSLQPYTSKSFAKSDFDSNSTIRFYYSEYDYSKAKNSILSEAQSYFLFNVSRKILHEAFTKSISQKISKKRTTSSILDYLGTYTLNRVAKDKINTLLHDCFIRFLANEKLYQASQYQESEFYNEELAPKNLFDIISKNKSSKKSINPLLTTSVIFPLFKTSPSEFNKHKGSTFSISLGASLAISPEWKWSKKSESYSRLYLKGDFDNYVHDFRDTGDSLFVGRQYANSRLGRNFYSLLTIEGAFMTLRYFGLGAVLRTTVRDGTFFDFGAGYRLSTGGIIRFTKKFNDGESYLEDGATLDGGKQRNVVSGQKNIYAIINFGLRMGRNKKPGSPLSGGYILFSLRAFQNTLTHGGNHHIYTKVSQTGDFERIPVTRNGNNIMFSGSVGIGYAF